MGARRSDVIPSSVAVCLVCGEAERVLRDVLATSLLSEEEERERCYCLSGTLSITSVVSFLCVRVVLRSDRAWSGLCVCVENKFEVPMCRSKSSVGGVSSFGDCEAKVSA